MPAQSEACGGKPKGTHRWMMGSQACHPFLYRAVSAGVAEVASIQSDCPRLNLRWKVKVGAWKIHSLHQDEQLPLLSKEMGRLRVEVSALSEVRRPGNGTIGVGGYTYYWLGHGDGHHLQEVTKDISGRL